MAEVALVGSEAGKRFNTPKTVFHPVFRQPVRGNTNRAVPVVGVEIQFGTEFFANWREHRPAAFDLLGQTADAAKHSLGFVGIIGQNVRQFGRQATIGQFGQQSQEALRRFGVADSFAIQRHRNGDADRKRPIAVVLVQNG